MLKRKIQKIGQRSFFITLPKSWVKQKNLKEHDFLNIEITKNNDILITNDEKAKIKKEITLKDEKDLENLIFLIYYKDIKEVILKKRFLIEDKKNIKKTLNILDDFKIIEEDEDSIKIICTTEYSNISIDSLLRRQIYLIKLSINGIEKKDKQLIEENEREINKIYHLIKKKLILSVIDTKERELNKIKDIIETFYLDEIIKKIENIADLLYEMQFVKFSLKTLNTIKEYIYEIERIFINNDNLENLKKLIKKYNTYNIRLKSIEGRITLLCKDILECLIELELNKKYF